MNIIEEPLTFSKPMNSNNNLINLLCGCGIFVCKIWNKWKVKTKEPNMYAHKNTLHKKIRNDGVL